MHYLHNLNKVMLSEVWQLETTYLNDWERITQLMRVFAERDNTVIEGSSLVTN